MATVLRDGGGEPREGVSEVGAVDAVGVDEGRRHAVAGHRVCRGVVGLRVSDVLPGHPAAQRFDELLRFQIRECLQRAQSTFSCQRACACAYLRAVRHSRSVGTRQLPKVTKRESVNRPEIKRICRRSERSTHLELTLELLQACALRFA
jgi:hypothetical protein